MSEKQQESPRRLIAGPAIVLVASLVGIWLCHDLTSLKFLHQFQHCLAPKTGCSTIAGMECSYALASPISTLFGLPITVYGFGFYSLTAILSISLMISVKSFFGLSRIALFGLASCNVVVSCFLGAYAIIMLSEMCALCTGLYGVSGVILIATVALIDRPWTMASRGRLQEIFKRPERVLDGGFILAYLAVFMVGAYAISYQYKGRKANRIEGCPVVGVAIDPPPPAKVLVGSDVPDVLVFAFLDPSCPVCLEEFGRLETLVKRGAGDYRVQAHLYQFPRDGAGSCVPEGLMVSHPEAEQKRACWASLAVECVEKLKPGHGVEMLRQLFFYQQRRASFSKKLLDVLAQNHGLEAADTFGTNPVIECLERDSAVLQHVRDSMAYLAKFDEEYTNDGLQVPYIIVVPVLDGEPDFKRAFFLEGKRLSPQWIIERVDEARQAKKIWEEGPVAR